LPLLLLAISGCGADHGTTPEGYAGVVLVRQLEGRGDLIELSPTRELAVLTVDRLVVLNAIEGDTVYSAPPPIHADEYSDRGLAFSGDGRLLAASMNNALVVVDLSSRTEMIRRAFAIDRLPFSIGALAFAPDDSLLLIGGQMPRVLALDLQSGRFVDTLLVRYVTGISILPDRSTAAVADFFGDVQLWTWKEHRAVDTLGVCGRWCDAAASTDRFLAAGCGGDTIRVWDSRTFQFHGFLQGHRFIGLRFSAGGSGLLLAGSGPGTSHPPNGETTSEILLFDLDSLQPIASWRAHSSDGIYDTAMTPDGSLFATCGYDGIVNLWRLRE
jgi:WD40 repeat protein